MCVLLSRSILRLISLSKLIKSEDHMLEMKVALPWEKYLLIR
jgi:hypothetical protein